MKLELETAAAQNPPAAVHQANFDNDRNAAEEEVENLISSAIELTKAGDASAARQKFLRAVELDPLSEPAWLWLASISEYPEELIVFLQKVLDINPKNERAVEWMRATRSLLSKTFVQRGIKAAQEDRKAFAAQCFRQAIGHDEANEMGWLWLASLSEDKGEKAGLLRKALALNPENSTAREALLELESRKSQELLQVATSAAISGNREEARRMLEEILAESPEMEEAWILQSYLAENFYDKMSAYEKVLAINPENEAAQAGLASLRAMQKAKDLKAPVAVKPAPQAEVPIAEKSAKEAEFSAEEEETLSEETSNFAPAEEFVGEAAEEATNLFVDAESENTVDFDSTEDAAGSSVEAQIEAGDAALPAPETTNFKHSTHELDPEVLAAAEKTFGQDGESTDESFETAEDSAPENFSFSDEDESFAEEQPTENVNEEDFARLISSEDADAVELLDADDLDYENFGLETADYGDQYAAETLPSSISDETPAFDLPGVAEENAPETAEQSEDFSPGDDHLNSFAPETSPATADPSSASMPADLASNSANYSAPSPDYTLDEAEPAKTEVYSSETLAPSGHETHASAETSECPFCSAQNEAQVVVCGSCNAMLSLSDLESLLRHQGANSEVLLMAINDLEAEKLHRGLSVMQLTDLGTAYLNAGDLRKGLEALREASRISPNNVVLSSKVNYLTIRLAEIEAQDCKSADSAVKCKTIMVVDDSPTVRKLISGKLEKSGHTVVCAVDGMDALSKVGEQMPDLILLDINMPNMDGYQVCKLIRSNELTKHIPVVMISGKDGFFDKVRGRMAGSTDYITKPFGPETLMRTLETYLN